MLEVLIASAGLGFLLGLRYRVLVALIASLAVSIAAASYAHAVGAGSWTLLLLPVGALAALQCGYLGGVVLGVAGPRRKTTGKDRPAASRAQAAGVEETRPPAVHNQSDGIAGAPHRLRA